MITKKYIGLLISILLLLISKNSIKAQDSLIAYDTVNLMRSDAYHQDYSVDDSVINKISIQISAPRQMNNVHFKFGGELIRGALTLATGLGISSDKNVDWYLPGTIRTNNQKLDWISDIYCPGYVEKQRERVTNSDGSKTVETNYVNVFLWQQGALGYIIEAGDTIGWYYVIRSPRTDTALVRFAEVVYKGETEHKTINYMEFAVLGEFLGKKSAILFNSDENRLYIFDQYNLKGICQLTKPPSLIVRKKKRKNVQPYLLVNENLAEPERIDIIRLAMLAIRFKNAVETN